ncbi:MAG: D-aminoacyl-tRNA deacylase [Actinomycetota bacterium]
MRAVVQRASSARVTIDDEVVGAIGRGVVVLVGITHDDGEAQARSLADKVANLRIFSDQEGKMNHSLLDVEGAALVVSQFTLYGDARKGRRPSFVRAAEGEAAHALYLRFVQALEGHGVPCATGRFGATMMVSLTNEWDTKRVSSGAEPESDLSVARFSFTNDGPVTILLDSDKEF